MKKVKKKIVNLFIIALIFTAVFLVVDLLTNAEYIGKMIEKIPRPLHSVTEQVKQK